jgi:hypothetical protein
MVTDAQRRAHTAHRERLAAQGLRAVTVRLSQKARDRLAELAKAHGSQDKAIEALLLGKPTAGQAPKPSTAKAPTPVPIISPERWAAALGPGPTDVPVKPAVPFAGDLVRKPMQKTRKGK